MTKRHLEPIKDEQFSYLKYTGHKEKVENRTMYEFECECSSRKLYLLSEIVRGIRKSCGCRSTVKDWKKKLEFYGEDYCYYIIWACFKERAKQRKILFELEVQDIKSKYLEQKGLCRYTKLPIRLPNTFTDFHTDDNVSIDRIDPNLGYIKSNIQLVRKEINFMKSDLSHEEFVKICKDIHNYQESKKNAKS